MRTPILLALILAACGSVNASDPRYEQATAAELSELVERIEALETKVTALEAENASLRTDLDAVKVASGVADYWLYDGNGVKKWKVGSTPDKHGLVEVEPGIWASYQTDQHENTVKVGGAYVLYYTGQHCTGTPIAPAGQFNRLYTFRNWAFKIGHSDTYAAARNGYSIAYDDAAQTCINYTSPINAPGYAIAVSFSAIPYTLQGPLSVSAN